MNKLAPSALIPPSADGVFLFGAVAVGVALVPVPSAANDLVDSGIAWLPPQFLTDFFGRSNQYRRISRAARAKRTGDGASRLSNAPE